MGILSLLGAGNAGYTGPLDLVSVTASAAYCIAYKLRAAYTGALVRLRRASDDAEQDFSALTTGLLDTGAVNAFLAATTGYIVTVYDQTGNGYHQTQADTTKQPLYAASWINSGPAFTYDGINDVLVYAAGVPGGTAGAVFVAGRTPATIAASYLVSSDDTASTARYIDLAILLSKKMYLAQRNNDVADTVTGDTELAVDTNYVLTWISDGAAWTMRANGDDQTLTVGGLNSGDWFGDTDNRDNLVVGAKIDSGGAAAPAKFTFQAVIIYANELTAGAITVLEQALAAAMGISFSVALPLLGVLGFVYASSIGT